MEEMFVCYLLLVVFLHRPRLLFYFKCCDHDRIKQNKKKKISFWFDSAFWFNSIEWKSTIDWSIDLLIFLSIFDFLFFILNSCFFLFVEIHRSLIPINQTKKQWLPKVNMFLVRMVPILLIDNVLYQLIHTGKIFVFVLKQNIDFFFYLSFIIHVI